MEKVTTQFAADINMLVDEDPAKKMLSYLTHSEVQTQSNEDFSSDKEINRQLIPFHTAATSQPISPLQKSEAIKLKVFSFPSKKVEKKEKEVFREQSPKINKRKLDSQVFIPGSLTHFKSPNSRAAHHYGGSQSRKSWRGSDIPSPRSPTPSMQAAQSPAMSNKSGDKNPSSKHRRLVDVKLCVEMNHSQSKGSQLGIINSANHSVLEGNPKHFDDESHMIEQHFDDPDRQYIADYAYHQFANMDRQAQAHLINQDLASVDPQITGTVLFRPTMPSCHNVGEMNNNRERKTPITPLCHQTLYLNNSLPTQVQMTNSMASAKCQIEVNNVYAPNESVTVQNQTLHTQTGDESPRKESDCRSARFEASSHVNINASRSSELASVEIPNQIKVNQSQFEGRRPVQLRNSHNDLKMHSDSEDIDQPQLTAIRSESKSFATQMAETSLGSPLKAVTNEILELKSKEVNLRPGRSGILSKGKVGSLQHSTPGLRESQPQPQIEKLPSEELEPVSPLRKPLKHKSSIKVEQCNESSLVLFKQFQGQTSDLPSMDSDLSQLNQAQLEYAEMTVSKGTQAHHREHKVSHKDLGLLEQQIAPLKPFQSPPKQQEPTITWVDYFKPPTPIKESSVSAVSSSPRMSPEQRTPPFEDSQDERMANMSPAMVKFAEQFQSETDQYILGLQMQAKYGSAVTNVKVLKFNEEFLKKMGHSSRLKDKGRTAKTWQQSAAEMMYLIQRRQAPKVHFSTQNFPDQELPQQKQPIWQDRMKAIRRSERESKMLRHLYLKRQQQEAHQWKSATSPQTTQAPSNKDLRVLNACEPTPINQQQLVTDDNPLIKGTEITPSNRYIHRWGNYYSPEVEINVEQTRSSSELSKSTSREKVTYPKQEWIKVVFEDQKKASTAVPGKRRPTKKYQQVDMLQLAKMTMKEMRDDKKIPINMHRFPRGDIELEPSRTDRTNSSISQRTIKLSPDKYGKMRKSKNRPINQDLDLSSDSAGSQERHATSGVSLHMSARIYSKATTEKKIPTVAQVQKPVVKVAVPMSSVSRVTSRDITSRRSRQTIKSADSSHPTTIVPKTPDHIKISSKPNSQSRNYASRNSKYVSEEISTVNVDQRQQDTPNESAQNLSETRLGSVIITPSNNDLDKVASAVNVESDDKKLKVPKSQTHELFWLLRHNPNTTGLLERVANKRTTNIAKTFMRQIPDQFPQEHSLGFHSIRSRQMQSADVTTKNSEHEYEIFEKEGPHTPKKGGHRILPYQTPLSDSQKMKITEVDQQDEGSAEPSTPFVLNSNKGSMVSNLQSDGRSPGDKTPPGGLKGNSPILLVTTPGGRASRTDRDENPLNKLSAFKTTTIAGIAVNHVPHSAETTRYEEQAQAAQPSPPLFYQQGKVYGGHIAPIVLKSKDYKQLEAGRLHDELLHKEFQTLKVKSANRVGMTERYRQQRHERSKRRFNKMQQQALVTERSSQLQHNKSQESSRSGQSDGALSLVIQNVLGKEILPGRQEPFMQQGRKFYPKVNNTKSSFSVATYPRRIIKMRGTQVMVNQLTGPQSSHEWSSQSLQNQTSQFANIKQQLPHSRFNKPNTPAANMGTRKKWGCFAGITTSQDSERQFSHDQSMFTSEDSPRTRRHEEATFLQSPGHSSYLRDSNKSNINMKGQPKFDHLQFKSIDSTQSRFQRAPVLKQPQQMAAYMAMQKAQYCWDKRLSKHNFQSPPNNSISVPKQKPYTLKPKMATSMNLQTKASINRSRRNKFDTSGIRVENTSKATSKVSGGDNMLTPDLKKDEEIHLQSKYHVLVMNSEEEGNRQRQFRSGY